MNKPYCEDCKYWSVPDHDYTYRVCLKWVRSDCGQLVPRKHNTGSVVLTPPAFGCNFFEGKLKGPFFVEKCGKNWYVMACFDELFPVNLPVSGLCVARRGYAKPISGASFEVDAKETVEWLNEHWLKRENPKGT